MLPFFSHEVTVRRYLPYSVFFLASLCAVPLPAYAVDQSTDIAKLFQEFCLSEQPSFDGMQAKALIMAGAKAVDHVENLGENRNMKQRAWLVSRPTGTYQITAVDGVGRSRAVGCEVTSQDGNGVDLAQTMALEIGLGAPFKRVPAVGSRGNTVMWNKNFGAHEAKILLSYGAQGAEGLSIHLILPNLPK
jgi:hypothetical protein